MLLDDDEIKRPKNSSLEKRNLYILIAVLTVCSLAFRLIGLAELSHTSVLFIGLPALLSVLIVKYTFKPKKLYGIVFRVITLFLLLSSILLGEGTICVLMAAPIFYIVGAVVVFLVKLTSKNKYDKFNSFLLFPVLLIIAQPFNIGKTPSVHQIVTSQIINKQVSFDALNTSPDFVNDLPTFFELGFPTPTGIDGTGTEIGANRMITFESSTKGTGILHLEVISKTANELVFNIKSDNTHIGHWLTWKQFKIQLNPISDTETEVIWTSDFSCDLGPQWYFETIEISAVDLMNQHLIQTYFE